MSSTHKLMATIPHGPSDEGAEIECEITFTFHQGRMAHGTCQHSQRGFVEELFLHCLQSVGQSRGTSMPIPRQLP